MLKPPVLAGLLLLTVLSRPAAAFEWLDRMIGIDLDGSQTAAYPPTAQPYVTYQPVPQPIAPGQAVAPLPQTVPVNPYSQPYYQGSTGNSFADCWRDCCDSIKDGCRRFCECICPPRQPLAAVAPIAYAPQPSAPVTPVPLAPVPMPNPYAQAQPVAPFTPAPIAPPAAPMAPIEPSCQGMIEPSCSAGFETTCEASCMAPMPVQQQMAYFVPVPVYAPPRPGFWQRLCECLCPPARPVQQQAAYAPMPMQAMQPMAMPTGQYCGAPQQFGVMGLGGTPYAAASPAQTGPYEGQITNVQWSDGVVTQPGSESFPTQPAPVDGSMLQPALPPAPVPGT